MHDVSEHEKHGHDDQEEEYQQGSAFPSARTLTFCNILPHLFKAMRLPLSSDSIWIAGGTMVLRMHGEPLLAPNRRAAIQDTTQWTQAEHDE
jgi:hypothetical protein